jgi:hypothetical protein
MGGSQREERLDVLKRRLAEVGLPEEPYWWYLELRKYGSGNQRPHKSHMCLTLQTLVRRLCPRVGAWGVQDSRAQPPRDTYIWGRTAPPLLVGGFIVLRNPVTLVEPLSGLRPLRGVGDPGFKELPRAPGVGT